MLPEQLTLAECTAPLRRDGSFAEVALESAYRAHHAAADRRTARACVLVSVVGCLAFISSDYCFFGDGAQFFTLLAMRAEVLLLSFLVWRQLRQDLSPSDFDYVTFLWGLLVVTQILYVTSTRPSTYHGHLVVNLSTVFLAYTMVPLPLKFQMILAGILSVGCALLAVGDGLGAAAMGWSLLGANLLGAFVSRRLHKQGREMFAARVRLEKSLAEVRTLRGLVRVCAWCKKVADEDEWEELEVYVRDHTHAEFTHGICPICSAAVLAELHQKSLASPAPATQSS